MNIKVEPPDGSWIASKGALGMFVMIDKSRMELIAIGEWVDKLVITQQPYCWHIIETGDSEWAVTVLLSHGQNGKTEWLVAVTQSDCSPIVTAAGGGPTQEVITEVARRVNECVGQFLR